MKLVEVVVLLGAQCISPVQNTGAVTEAAKVQCAVVVEKDTTAGTIRIVPAGASNHPQVVAVLDRLGNEAPPGTMIEPANAPATPSVPSRGALASPAPQPDAEPPATAAEPEPVKQEAKTAEKVPQARKTKPDKDQASAKPASQCIGTAKPKWYKAADGRRKYRCVTPG